MTLRQLPDLTDGEILTVVETLWQARDRAIRRACASQGARVTDRQAEAARYKALAVKLAAPAPRSPAQTVLDVIDAELARRHREVDHRNQFNAGGTDMLTWLRRRLTGRGR